MQSLRGDANPEGVPEAVMRDTEVTMPAGITSTRVPRPPRPRGRSGISEADQLNEREITRLLNERPQGGARQDGMKKGGMAKYAKGGAIASKMGTVKTAAPSRDGVAVKGKTKGEMIKMAKGGMTKKMMSGGKC
jgi:hypothetical protein